MSHQCNVSFETQYCFINNNHINVNDYSFTINIKKSKKYENTLNIFIYDKICGSIKNNIIKTNCPEIYDDIAVVGVIFLSYLLYIGVEDFKSIDYDKKYLSSSNKSMTES